MKKPIVAAIVALVFLAAPNLASADPTREECLDNNAKAQTLRNAGKMRAAREALLACGNPACPTMVRDDCQQRMDDLQRVLPTIVFEAKDAAGHDLVAVKVTLDGQVLAERLDGSAVVVDLGDHEFAFEVAGQAAVKQHFVIREGDKARHERIVIGEPPKPTEVTAQTAPATTTDTHDTVQTSVTTSSSGTGMRIAGLTIAGVGLIGGGVIGITLGALGNNKNAQILTDCGSPPQTLPNSSTCTNPAQQTQKQNDQSATSGLYTGEIVAFVVGGALLVGGLIMFLVTPSSKRTSSALRFVPSASPKGASFGLTGMF